MYTGCAGCKVCGCVCVCCVTSAVSENDFHCNEITKKVNWAEKTTMWCVAFSSIWYFTPEGYLVVIFLRFSVFSFLFYSSFSLEENLIVALSSNGTCTVQKTQNEEEKTCEKVKKKLIQMLCTIANETIWLVLIVILVRYSRMLPITINVGWCHIIIS